MKKERKIWENENTDNTNLQEEAPPHIIPSWKQKALGLNSRKVRTSFRDSLFGFQDLLYHKHS